MARSNETEVEKCAQCGKALYVRTANGDEPLGAIYRYAVLDGQPMNMEQGFDTPDCGQAYAATLAEK